MGDLSSLVAQLDLELLDLVNVLRLLLTERSLECLARLCLLPQLVFQLTDLGGLLLSNKFALVPFLGASAELVLHLTQLVLRLLLLAEHRLQLALLVVPGHLELLPQSLQFLRQALLLRRQLIHS